MPEGLIRGRYLDGRRPPRLRLQKIVDLRTLSSATTAMYVGPRSRRKDGSSTGTFALPLRV